MAIIGRKLIAYGRWTETKSRTLLAIRHKLSARWIAYLDETFLRDRTCALLGLGADNNRAACRPRASCRENPRGTDQDLQRFALPPTEHGTRERSDGRVASGAIRSIFV